MTAPHLRHRLVLEDPVRSADGAGGQRLTWVAVGTHWARIDAGAGRERAGEFLTLSSVPYRITVRAAAAGAPSRPKPHQRFRAGARLFRIVAVTDDDAHPRYLICHVIEETPK